MRFRITKEYVWAGNISDHPGALADRLRALHQGGLNLDLIVSHRSASGQATMFISPLRSLDDIAAAEKIGLRKEDSFFTLRIVGPNASGIGARLATAVAQAGINLRAFTAVATGDQQVTNMAFDTSADADRAKDVLTELLRT